MVADLEIQTVPELVAALRAPPPAGAAGRRCVYGGHSCEDRYYLTHGGPRVRADVMREAIVMGVVVEMVPGGAPWGLADG
jgi:hypothetical protein